jgi:hypothetical protein
VSGRKVLSAPGARCYGPTLVAFSRRFAHGLVDPADRRSRWARRDAARRGGRVDRTPSGRRTHRMCGEAPEGGLRRGEQRGGLGPERPILRKWAG